MNTKQAEILGAVALGLLAIGLVIWYMSEHPAPYVNPGTGTSTPLGQTSGSSAPSVITETGKYYDIKTSYPSSTSLKTSASAVADAKAVEVMKQFELNSIDAFKEQGNFANLSAEDITMLGFDKGRREDLEISYIEKSSPATISYLFTLYMDTLGAHPNTYFRSFTFGKKTGAGLELGDIFKPGADYLNALSTISRKKLPAVIAASTQEGASQVDKDMINAGTTADADNFQNWYLDGSYFVLVFAPYQVAPYAAGVQTLRIPVSDLSSVIDPAFR